MYPSIFYSWANWKEKEDLFRVNRHNLSTKLSLTCDGNVSYYKSVRHPIPNKPSPFSKQISKFFFQLRVQVYFLLGQTGGERKAFLEGARRRAWFRDYLQEHLVVIRDDPVTKKNCMTWSTTVNFWIDSRTCQK